MQRSSRREFLKNTGTAALGLVAVSVIAEGALSCASTGASLAQTSPPTTTPKAAVTPVTAVVALPWPYKKIDPIAAAERAYAAYYDGGCMYGGFEGIIGELRTLVGAPYDTFPSAMTKYGAAGVSGWGTLCGALNGIAAAIYLVTDSKVSNPLINEIYGWYGATALPDYKPAKPKIASIATSVADSQLCHISVSKWAFKTGLKTTSPERADRCAWLTASVVRYTADLLNKAADGTFKQTFADPASVTGCLSCHGKGGAVENVHASNQTTCTNCHDVLPPKHPAVAK